MVAMARQAAGLTLSLMNFTEPSRNPALTPPGMPRAGADAGMELARGAVVLAGRGIRHHDVGVAAPQAGVVVEPLTSTCLLPRTGTAVVDAALMQLATSVVSGVAAVPRIGRREPLPVPLGDDLVVAPEALAEDDGVGRAILDHGQRDGRPHRGRPELVGGAVEVVEIVGRRASPCCSGSCGRRSAPTGRRSTSSRWGRSHPTGRARSQPGDADGVVEGAAVELGHVERIEQRRLLHEVEHPRLHRETGDRRAVARGGQGTVDVGVVHGRQAELLEVVDALRPPGGLARRLDGGQEQCDQDGDDRDDDQELDQRKAAALHRVTPYGGTLPVWPGCLSLRPMYDGSHE